MLGDKLQELHPDHRDALLWFWERRGQEIPWTSVLDERVYLMNRHKGIHKPKGWRHVLSVRESLSGPYTDEHPVEHADGSWTYRYFQEGLDPSRRDDDFTNRGLLECAKDGVPVAVLRQVARKPAARYTVLGLATVGDWQEGYFVLHGYPHTMEILNSASLVAASATGSSFESNAPPMSLEDARQRIEAAIVQRQGAAVFRGKLIAAFGGRCALSDCDAVEALEAAHIVPYRGSQTDVVENGLLLRADLHTLFDRQLIEIDPLTLRVSLAPALRKTSYGSLEGKALRLPVGVKPAALCQLLAARREFV